MTGFNTAWIENIKKKRGMYWTCTDFSPCCYSLKNRLQQLFTYHLCLLPKDDSELLEGTHRYKHRAIFYKGPEHLWISLSGIKSWNQSPVDTKGWLQISCCTGMTEKGEILRLLVPAQFWSSGNRKMDSSLWNATLDCRWKTDGALESVRLGR